MITQKKPISLAIIAQCLICGLVSCGTLGGIGDGIYFPISKKKLEIAMDSLYVKHPEYKTPKDWEKFNNWSERGYEFLESRIFYFKSSPEEMYYVTFIGDSTALANTMKIRIGIRALNKGNYKWLLDDDLDSKEKERVEKRFDVEIISKLEEYTKTKASKE
jgi:hypothetical protein